VHFITLLLFFIKYLNQISGGRNMKNILKHTIEAFEDFTSGQLKAFYVGHADSYAEKLSNSFEITVAEAAIFTFPEWVAPACALFAAASCLTKIVIKSIKLLFKKD